MSSTQAGCLRWASCKQAGESAVLAVGGFAINEQREAFIEGEFMGGGLFELLGERHQPSP